jgi:hypothetical protein
MLCHYAECLHAECEVILIVMLNIVVLSVVATLFRVAIYILVQKASVFYTYKIFQLWPRIAKERLRTNPTNAHVQLKILD